MSSSLNRRDFLRHSSLLAAAVAAGWSNVTRAQDAKPLFKISLAEWSLHKTIFGKKLDHLDFAKTAKHDFGFEAVEYVNQFFFEKAKDQTYLAEMKKRADGEGVKSLLIMIDREGNLGDADDAKRTLAVENHFKWVEAAKFLGCHSIESTPAAAAPTPSK